MFSPFLFLVEGGAYGAFEGRHEMISHFVGIELEKTII